MLTSVIKLIVDGRQLPKNIKKNRALPLQDVIYSVQVLLYQNLVGVATEKEKIMFQNANPIIYMLGATATICSALAIPTAIIEKKERDKKNGAKRNNINKSTRNNQRNVNNVSDWSMGEDIQVKKRKSCFIDLTPYEVKK